MTFFDPALAAQLQYVTLPLEFIGLTLAAIEIRLPSTAARLVAWIQATERRLLEAETARRATEPSPVMRFFDRVMPVTWALAPRVNRIGTIYLCTLLSAQIMVAVATSAGWVGETLGEFLTTEFYVYAVLLVAPLYFAPFLVYQSMRFATRFAEGREVGNLGLLIAALGLLGELYQFLTPFFA